MALRILWFVVAAVLLSGSLTGATVRRQYVGDSIPERLPLDTRFIITDSDTLRLNGQLLQRGEDYQFNDAVGSFDLSGIVHDVDDTLSISYRPLPAWLKTWYGRDIPEIRPGIDTRSQPIPADRAPVRPGEAAAGVTLSGSKSFRFSAQSTGTSEFSQSLNLNITGELTPGLTISGAIADRGFDPSYGTLNSRLQELDKINVRVESQRLTAQLGDITVTGLPNQQQSRQVSGASARVTFPNWNLSATAARPRGRFETARFFGSDGFQGPYQITAGTGQAIVPGSETVWLDGIPLERGSNKDYTMEYPTGRITFSVANPIDSRSRIEIDYEPLVTAYDQELLAAGAGASVRDSLFFFSVGVLREGDDRDQREAGELSESDRALLEAGGDQPVFRSGVTADTSGAYALIVDSLPDSVYHYVGSGNGEFNVVFSFVGDSVGAYRFVGGEVYEFVGDGNGEYAPVVELTPASRTDQYQSILGLNHPKLGRLTADIRQTDFDRNLFSPLDDGDNAAAFYNLAYERQWRMQDTVNTITARRRLREANFETRERINRPDFERSFYLPQGFVQQGDERLHEVSAAVTSLDIVSIDVRTADLDYDSQFGARRGDVGATIRPHTNLTGRVAYGAVSTDLDSAGVAGDGSVDIAQAELAYLLYGTTKLRAAYEYDRRSNAYLDTEQGARYNQIRVDARRGTEYVRWERYVEDTLTEGWREALDRQRLSAGSSRRLGRLDYDATLTYQWLTLPAAEENSFLGRLNLRYDDPASRLSVSSSYLISEEVRNARGISFLEVEPGQGDFIFEDGQYIPDPEGNFIRVEELLSSTDRVRRGEKSFYLSKGFGFGIVRLNSDIREELLPAGTRTALWALPFFADSDEPFLFFQRQYSGDVKLIPLRGFHLLNAAYNERLERRRILDVDRDRRDREGSVSLRQQVAGTFFEEKGSLFTFERDQYYSGAGDITGFAADLTVRQTIGMGELSAATGFRRADDDLTGARSEIVSVTLGSRLRVIERGELRTSLELYRQTLSGEAAGVSYQLTNNRPGNEGARWSVSLNYGVRENLRVNLNLSGRHADTRTARVFGRGEVVAGF
ncbi:hypothetical protein GF420_06445 [candidate division GN15 bacterium]|nr:hypothetical protein [candidate division GN15 bacterium]